MVSSSEEGKDSTIYSVVHCETKEKHKTDTPHFSKQCKCGAKSQLIPQWYLGLKSSNA